MEEYLHKLKRYSQHGRHHGYSGMGHSIKKFKKLLIVGLVMAVVVAVALVILAIAALNWLFSRGDNAKQAAQSVSQQVEVPAPSLDVGSYINGSQVDADRLVRAYDALPSQLQDAWLGDLRAQIDELKKQAGVTTETIQSLTDVYNILLGRQ